MVSEQIVLTHSIVTCLCGSTNLLTKFPEVEKIKPGQKPISPPETDD